MKSQSILTSRNENYRFTSLHTYGKLSAIAVAMLGCVVLCGWALRIDVLLSILPGAVTMKANVALAFACSGISLWLLLPATASARARVVGRFLGGGVLLFGAVTVCEYIFHVSSPFDQLLVHDIRGSIGTTSPGRMAPATATALIAIGAALMLLSRREDRDCRVAQVLSLWPGLIGVMTLSGYLYHATSLTRLFLYTQVAFHTAIGLLFLSGALFFARPRSGFAQDLAGDGSGSVMARRLLPALLLVPFVLGWIRLQGQLAGLYGTELGVALEATSSLFIFGLIVWVNARQLNKEYDRRSMAEVALDALNKHLEQQVAERTKMLEEQSAILQEQAALVDLAHDSIFVRDMNDRITFWNKGAAQKYGWTKEQVLGHVTHEVLRTKFPGSLGEIKEQLLTHGSWEGELLHARADGSHITVASRWALQRDVHGNPSGVLEINNDITERKRSQDALLLSEERLKLLTKGVKDHAIFMLDPQGLVATWNEGAERIKGYVAGEIIGQHFSKFYPPEAVAEGTPQLVITTAAEQGYCEDEGWRMRKDGSRFWASVVITALRDQTGHLQGFGKVTRDITVRRESESKIRSLAERLALATTIARVGVWEWDLTSNTIAWDATMFDIYGFLRDRGLSEEKWSAPMPYEKWAATVHPEDLPPTESILRRTIEERGQESAEFRITRPNGSVRDILAIEKAVLNLHGEVVRVVGVNTDVTERKEAAKVLAQNGMNQLRLKDEFLSHVSHEIRAPLSAIMQFTTIILDGLAGELTPEQREYEQIVLQNARQLRSMITDLLDVTRLESGKLTIAPESLSIPEAVSDVLNTLHGTAGAAGVSLSSELSEDLAAAFADSTRVRQILIILVDNAIKFTPRGGAVRIRVQPWEEDLGFLRIGVLDTGSGIRPEKVGRIFERLYQASDQKQNQEQGLGLGLFICKELVTRQGGQIWVESELQKGSTFSFTLPVFSLKNLIAPMLKNDKWPNESVALLTLRIRLREPWPSKESREEWSGDVRRLLLRCTLPDLDVLLPKMSDVEQEQFFILAFADEKGATVLANRIREQFKDLPPLNQPAKCFTVSHTMLNSLPSDSSMPVSDAVTAMLASVEQAIRCRNMESIDYA